MVVGRSEVGKGKGLSRLIFKLGFSMVLYFSGCLAGRQRKRDPGLLDEAMGLQRTQLFFFSLEKSG